MMTLADRQKITDLLVDWSRGDRQALDQLMPLVNAELRNLAKNYLAKEPRHHTLQPTALVNELYLRLVDRHKMSWRDRAHFFAFASRTMRRILVDHARARKAAKRGQGAQRVTLEEARHRAETRAVDILALHEALKDLAKLDERQSRVIELRVFAGLDLRQTSEVLGVSTATVSREWASAKAWLYAELAME
ncbi:MAG: ECF-type sigma factor [Acidobacteriota bacterium]